MCENILRERICRTVQKITTSGVVSDEFFTDKIYCEMYEVCVHDPRFIKLTNWNVRVPTYEWVWLKKYRKRVIGRFIREKLVRRDESSQENIGNCASCV